MADAVSGGNGLFLMTKQLITNIDRTSGRPEPILCTMAQAVDYLSRIGNTAIVQEPIEPLRRGARAMME